jgi:hypothetical protein
MRLTRFSIFGSVALYFFVIPSVLIAETVPFVCDLEFASGTEATWIFEVDFDLGRSDIGNDVVVQYKEDVATVFWESNACRALREGITNDTMCMKNFMIINRRSVRSFGAIEGHQYSGKCRIEQVDKKF